MSQPLELSPAQLRVMASPARAEIVGALAETGPLSAREIAARLTTAVNPLYHHLDQLERAGLVCVVSIRPGARRPERVYALVARQISARRAARSAPGRAALARLSRRLLAGAARAVADALITGEGVTEGKARDTAVRRVQVRLNAQALARLNAELDALLHQAEAQAGAKGKGVQITIALAPTRKRKRRTA
jgi:DNA-binding transcriptional ArsR family regulator